LLGTLINTATVLVGGAVGLMVHNRLPERYRHIAFQGLGLITLFLGVSMALKSVNALVLILSVLAGGVTGEWLKIEASLTRVAERLRTIFSVQDGRFSEGVITAFLLFCMGPLTILGAMEEGMGNGMSLLLAKSVLDGFAAIALAATLGVGVLFSVLPLLLYQGLWTAVGVGLSQLLPDAMVQEISAVGGVLLLGLSFKLLNLLKIQVLNFLPALIFAVLFSLLFSRLSLG